MHRCISASRRQLRWVLGSAMRHLVSLCFVAFAHVARRAHRRTRSRPHDKTQLRRRRDATTTSRQSGVHAGRCITPAAENSGLNSFNRGRGCQHGKRPRRSHPRSNSKHAAYNQEPAEPLHLCNNYLRRRLARGEGIASLSVRLSCCHAVCVSAALVAAAKVMSCIRGAL